MLSEFWHISYFKIEKKFTDKIRHAKLEVFVEIIPLKVILF